MMPQHVVLRAICRRYERRRDTYRQRHYKSGDDASLLLTKLQHSITTENVPTVIKIISPEEGVK
jgi:hypothetical protein